MGIEKEIKEILDECEADDLAKYLLAHTRTLRPPNMDDRESLARILEDISRDVPVYMALWIAFWMGCAYQDARISEGQL